MFDLNFYRGKRVFITGHTGFKGAWLCKLLSGAGALVTGYGLKPPTAPSLFGLAGISRDVDSVTGEGVDEILAYLNCPREKNQSRDFHANSA